MPPSATPQNYVPFPTFARAPVGGGVGAGGSPWYTATEGSSHYNSLQASFERQFSGGFRFLANYTYSQCRTDSRDSLEGDIGSYRAPALPGFGIQGDWALCDFDFPQLFHFNGQYQLPVGPGKALLSHSSGVVNQVLGGWSMNWIMSLPIGRALHYPVQHHHRCRDGLHCLDGTRPG